MNLLINSNSPWVQVQSLQELHQSMQSEAVSVGESILVGEAALDRAFADKTISQDSLIALTGNIATAQGKLRAVHLKYHLLTAELLSEDQRGYYSALRGYR